MQSRQHYEPAMAVTKAMLAYCAMSLSAIVLTTIITFDARAATVGDTASAPGGAADAARPARAPAPVARGRYLVKTMGCADCHTPLKMGAKGPEPDFSRGLSGHPQDAALPPAPAAKGPWLWGGSATNTAFWGPWGVSFAANLTSDKATGVGAWSDSNFISAMRNGKHLGAGRPILPPMPWQAAGQLNDKDLRAMLAYLKSEPPIQNLVPQPLAPTP